MTTVGLPPKVRPLFNSLLKTSTLVFLFVLGAKTLNFFKKILIGNLFGVSSVADAFFAASYLPYYTAIFFEGVLYLSFLPLFSKIVTTQGEKEGEDFIIQSFLFTLLATGFAVAVIWQFSPWFVDQLVPGFHSGEKQLTQSLLLVMSFMLTLLSLGYLFRVLNGYRGHYVFASSSGLVDTVVMIGAMLLMWRLGGIYAAAWASVLGTLVTLLAQGGFFFAHHPMKQVRLKLSMSWLGKLTWFCVPMGIVWGLEQIPLVIINRFSSGMWEGTLSTLTIAFSLVIVPIGLVSHTILIAIFPNLARQASETNHDELQKTFFQTLRAALFILIPLGVLFSSFARPLTLVLFGGGSISEEGIERIANSLAATGWAAFALYADLFMKQSLLALRRPVPAMAVSASRAVLTYGICYFTSWIWDYQGLAFGVALAATLNLLLLFPPLLRRTPFFGKWTVLFQYMAKLFLACLPMLALGLFINQFSLANWKQLSTSVPLLVCFGAGLVGIPAYLSLAALFRVGEIGVLLESFKGWGKKGIPAIDVGD